MEVGRYEEGWSGLTSLITKLVPLVCDQDSNSPLARSEVNWNLNECHYNATMQNTDPWGRGAKNIKR